ncbi:hypothetical protein M1N56_03590 [Dehalococcoidia bacterium]|nr:hypothetical protein [Dehalococcoidia bacterium]
MVFDKRSDGAQQNRRAAAFHVRKLVFQLAEVVVTRDMFSEMLEMIGRLRAVPGWPTTG